MRVLPNTPGFQMVLTVVWTKKPFIWLMLV